MVTAVVASASIVGLTNTGTWSPVSWMSRPCQVSAVEGPRWVQVSHFAWLRP